MGHFFRLCIMAFEIRGYNLSLRTETLFAFRLLIHSLTIAIPYSKQHQSGRHTYQSNFAEHCTFHC